MKNRKWFSLLLVLAMLFTCIPTGMFAEDGDAAEPAQVVSEEPAPVVSEESAPAAEDPAPVAQNPAPAAEDPAPAAQDPAPVAEDPEPVAEDPKPVAEDPEPAAEDPAPVAEDPEPVAEDPAPAAQSEAEPEADAFAAGLAALSEGDVFNDKYLNEAAGSVTEKAVVYAEKRVIGEGELSKNDVIRIAVNVAGEIKTFYVKNERLTYLSEDEVTIYNNANHNDGVKYQDVKLDAAAFSPVEKDEEAVPDNVGAVEPKSGSVLPMVVNGDQTQLAGGEVELEDILLTTGEPITITQQPTDVEAAVGTYFTVSVVAEGSNLSYDWQFLNAGKTKWNTTTSLSYKNAQLTLKATEAIDGRSYRCVITDDQGNTITSNAVTLTIKNEYTDGNFNYKLSDDGNGMIVTKCLLEQATVVVPAMFQNLPIVEIGEEAFMSNTSLVSIDLPNTIVTIRARAFKNCTSLSEMKTH